MHNSRPYFFIIPLLFSSMPIEYLVGIAIAILAYVIGLFTNRPGEKPVETPAPVQQPPQIVVIPAPADPNKVPEPITPKKPGYASVVKAWTGRARNPPKETPYPIILEGDQKILYELLGQREGEVYTGLFVDGVFIKGTSMTVDADDIGNTDIYSFTYPSGFRQPGEHIVEFRVAPNDGTIGEPGAKLEWASVYEVTVKIPEPGA